MGKDFNLALTHYQNKLEDLTFNSKPLIDDLTRTAGLYGSVGGQVVELIQTRLKKVAGPEEAPFFMWNFLMITCVHSVQIIIHFCNNIIYVFFLVFFFEFCTHFDGTEYGSCPW